MQDNLISIVIPIYNAETTIARCIESVLNNTYKNIELLLIDDKSTDSSFEICKKYSSKNDHIYLFQNHENQGVSYTRNKGIENANGKYVIFIDSDDWIEKNHIEILINGMQKKDDTSFIITGYINDDRKFNDYLSEIKFKQNLYENYNLQEIIIELYLARMLEQLWNKIFLRKVIEDNKIYFDETMSLGEDARFILMYLKCSNIKEVSVINECNYHYMREQTDSLMQKTKYKEIGKLIENIKIMYELTNLPKEKQKIEVSKKKNQLIQSSAYIVYHNPSLTQHEKKEIIYNLDAINGKSMYKENKKLYFKEKILNFIKKIG